MCARASRRHNKHVDFKCTKVSSCSHQIRRQLHPPHPRRVPEHRRLQPLAARGRGRWLYRCEGPRVSELQPPAVALERAGLRTWSLLHHVSLHHVSLHHGSLLHHVRWWRSRLERVAAAAAVSHAAPTRPPRASRNVAHVLSCWRHPRTPHLQLSFATPRPTPHGLAREVCVMRTARWCRASASPARWRRNVVARCPCTRPRLPAVAAVAAGGLLCSTAAEKRRRVRSRQSLARSG